MRRLSLSYTKMFDVYSPISNFKSSSPKIQFSVNCNVESLQDPTKVRSLEEAKSLHALTITMGPLTSQEPVFMHNNIMSKYACFGDIHMAHEVFEEMPRRNAISYNTMISAYCRDGFLQEALELFSEMRTYGFKPTQYTYGSLFSIHALTVLEGMQLHALIEKNGLLFTDPFSGTALLGMYGNHGFLEEAYSLFQCMPEKNVVTWNRMISVFGQMGWIESCVLMLSEMMMRQVGVSEYTFISVLSSLEKGDFSLGEQIHGLVVKCGFDNIPLISNCLINMYAKLDSSSSAEKMLENTSDKDIVSWNTVISALVNSDKPVKAIDYFSKMVKAGLSPNEVTIVNILVVCSIQQTLSSFGHCIHSLILKKNLESGVYAGSALVNFYAKCNELQKAKICFDGITHKNLVSWNSLLLAYAKRDPSRSIDLLQKMINSGYESNELSYSIAIKSSFAPELRQLHSLTIKKGYHENAYVSSSLISSYAKNGLISDALVFVASAGMKQLPVVSTNIIAWIYNSTKQYEKTQELYATVENPDANSWNILIAACSRNGDYKETFELFDSMRRSNQVYPDNYTYVSLFNVCTRLSNLALGSSLHALITKTDFTTCDTFVHNTMIDMYGKCGSVESSIKIFNDMTEKNIISWTAYISALGLHGYADEALEGFSAMERAGFVPDKVCFMAVLSSCRHAGLVKRGLEMFNAMKSKYGIEPGLYHYYLVVDLLSRYGDLKEAERFISSMPMAPNALVWRTFLEGCKKQRTKCLVSFT